MAQQGSSIVVDSVQKLLRRNADRNLIKALKRMHAADIANVLRHLGDKDRVRLWKLSPGLDLQAEVLAEADNEIKVALLAATTDDELVEILNNLFVDDARHIVDMLPEERANRILDSWKGKEAGEVDALLAFPPDTAGGIMSTEVFALPQNTTAREAIETLQASHEELVVVFYLYVVDELGQLVGVCSLRQLVISDPNLPLREFMVPDVVRVRTDTDQEEVARVVARYNFLGLPVVDQNNRLVGVVTVDDVIDVIKEEATEDILKMAGAGGSDMSDQLSPFRSVRVRMPWLVASFLGGLVSMAIIRSFSESIAHVAPLIAFIPITLGMGGNVGTQAATIVTRGIALGRINPRQFGAVIGREVIIGATLGVIYGLALSLFVAVVYSGGGVDWTGWQLAATVGLAIGACMMVAATVGGALPLFFEKLGIDPAIAAGPFVTTSVDILGITTYFLIGRTLLSL